MTAVERMVRDVSRLLNRDRPPEQNIADALAHCSKVTGRKRIPRPPAPDRKAQRKVAKKERRLTLSEIRVELHRETGGTCAVCRFGLPFVRMHAHHILSGPERQLEERQETMAPLHERCHEWVHGRDAKMDQRDALVRLLEWCEETGRTVAARSTRKRIGKMDEARSARPAQEGREP